MTTPLLHTLRLDWSWRDREGTRTLGALAVAIDKAFIWPTDHGPGDLEVFADDLLVFLVEIDPARAGPHNLAECFAGIYQLPPLRLRRVGPHLEMGTQDRTWQLPWVDALAVFGHLGDTLSHRLETVPNMDRLVTAWAHRRAGWLGHPITV